MPIISYQGKNEKEKGFSLQQTKVSHWNCSQLHFAD